MKKLSLVLAALVFTLALVPAGVAQAKKPLRSEIDYWFVGHLGILDAEGRLLVWEADISGYFTGTMKWWFVPEGGPPNMPDTAHVAFYEARWEIFDSADNLVLAGDSAGTTAMPPNKDGIWRGNGIVTEAPSGDFENLVGRHVYEGGNVNWDFPFSGSGIFRVN